MSNSFVLKAFFLVFCLSIFVGVVFAGGAPRGTIILGDANLGQQILLDNDINIADYNGYYQYEGSGSGDTNYIDINCNGYDVYGPVGWDVSYFFSNTNSVDSDLNKLILRDCNINFTYDNQVLIRPDGNLYYIEIYDSNFIFGSYGYLYRQAGDNSANQGFYFDNVNVDYLRLGDLSTTTASIMGNLLQNNNLSFIFLNSIISTLNIQDLNVISDANLFTFYNTTVGDFNLTDSDLNVASFVDVNSDSNIQSGAIYNNRILTTWMNDVAFYADEGRFNVDLNITLNENNSTSRELWLSGDDSNATGGNLWIDQYGVNSYIGDGGLDGVEPYGIGDSNYSWGTSSSLIYDYLPLVEYTALVSTIDLNAIDLNFSGIYIYGNTIVIGATGQNNGTSSATSDYNINYYINDALVQAYTKTADLAVDSNDYNSIDWTANTIGSTDVNVCFVYSGTDANTSNDCIQETITLNYRDLNIMGVSSSDSTPAYNTNVDFNVLIGNAGDYNSEDFNVSLYIINDSNSLDYNLKSWTLQDLNAASTLNLSYTWYANIDNNVDLNVVLTPLNADYNNTNNTVLFDKSLLVTKRVDMNATNLDLNDTSISAGDSVLATLTYNNSGDLNADANYTVVFYRDSTAITCTTSNTVTDDLNTGSSTTKTCAFTAPSPTSNTTYTIKGIVNYTDDKNVDNNYATRSLTVSAATTTSTSSGSSSSADTDSGIDLDALSLTYDGEVLINKDMTFKFAFKNIGDEDATSNYTASIVITQKGTIIKTLSQTYSEDLDSGASKTYTVTWKPTKVGYYSVEATVDYSGTDDDADNDTIDDKLLHVVSSLTATTTSTNNTNNTSTITATKNIGTNKTLQSASDFNSLIKDLTIAISDIPELIVPNDANSVYLPVEVTRIFKCDSNVAVCDVTISLHNVGTSTMSGYKYIEILPDLNGNDRYLTFDLNDINAGKYAILDYTLAASAIDVNNQAKFFSLVTNNTSKVILPKKSSSWSFDIPWKTIGFVVIIIIGAALLALLIYYLIHLIKSTKSEFRYYKNHAARNEEPAPKWQGIGGETSGQKYKGGKYKVQEVKVKGPKYNGWN